MKPKSRKELLKMYDWIGPFRNGLAKASRDGKFCHIRKDGTPAYKQRFDWVGDFRKGSAEAWKNGKRFCIRPDGTRVAK